MRVFNMTNMGNHYASQPSNDPSDSLKILYYMRRHQWKSTDEQLSNVVPDKYQLQTALNNLIREKAIVEVGRS